MCLQGREIDNFQMITVKEFPSWKDFQLSLMPSIKGCTLKGLAGFHSFRDTSALLATYKLLLIWKCLSLVNELAININTY